MGQVKDALDGRRPFIVFTPSGRFGGTYCGFSPVGGEGGAALGWDVVMSPPVVVDGELVEAFSFDSERVETLADLLEVELDSLVLAPDHLLSRLEQQLFVSADEVNLDGARKGIGIPTGRFIDADVLGAGLVDAVRAGNPEPWILENANLGRSSRDLASAIEESVPHLQLIIGVLESLGLRLAVVPSRAVAATYADNPWLEFGTAEGSGDS